jgi:putative oxidoreductase
MEHFNLLDEFNILRIICGLFFIPHIIGKLTSPMAIQMYSDYGFKPPVLWRNISAALEIIITIGLVFAIYTRYAAILGAVFFLVAAVSTWRYNGGKWLWNIGGVEYCVFWGLCCVVVAMHG